MADTFSPKFGNVVALPFKVANAVASQTNVDLSNDGGNTTYVMPHAGSVIGLSVRASADVTAGAVAFRGHSASTEFATTGYPAPALESVTNTNASYATIAPGAIRFAAGAKLGVSYTSDATMAPTNTNDFDCLLFVAFDPV